MVMIYKKAFGLLLSRLCEEKGWQDRGRQAELKRELKRVYQLDISQPAIKKWFDGDSLPEMDKALYLSDYFKVPLENLLRGSLNYKAPELTEKSVKETLAEFEVPKWPFGERITPEEYDSLSAEQKGNIEFKINNYIEDNGIKSHSTPQKRASN